jgi:hypothetical protein
MNSVDFYSGIAGHTFGFTKNLRMVESFFKNVNNPPDFFLQNPHLFNKFFDKKVAKM